MKSAARVLTTLLSTGVFLVACSPSEPSSGGTGGAAPRTGGATATGGTPSPSSGGAPGTGGAVTGSGGAPGTGGTVTSTGGASATGGASSGGAPGTGGSATTGGRNGGGTGGGMGSGGMTGTGGGTAGTSGGGFAPGAAILGMSCGTGQCHQGGNHTDLRNNAGLYARLVNAMPTGTMVETPACRMRTLVVPGNLTTSLVSNIIKPGGVSGCGPRMPNMCSATGQNPRPCLTAAQISTIDAWISAGAQM